MNLKIRLVLTVIILSVCTSLYAASAKGVVKKATKELAKSPRVTRDLVKFVQKTLVSHSTNSIFINAVQQQNKENTPLSEIQEIDGAWRKTKEILPIQTEKMTNVCAKEIKQIVKNNPVIVEAFVMDNQGAVVGENMLTSDYWQGDEAKWKNSYNRGKGGADVGAVKYDKSSKSVLQQVSLPIVTKKGKVIGAVTYGISVDRL